MSMKRLELLRNLREDHDLTQKQVGEILHISQRSYAHYESGTREIPLDILIRLADYYGVSLDYIVGRTDSK